MGWWHWQRGKIPPIVVLRSDDDASCCLSPQPPPRRCPTTSTMADTMPPPNPRFATRPTQQHVDRNIIFKPATIALLPWQRSARQPTPATALMHQQCHHRPNNATAHPPPSSSHPTTNVPPTPQHSRCPLPISTMPLHHHRPNNAMACPPLPLPLSLAVVHRAAE